MNKIKRWIAAGLALAVTAPALAACAQPEPKKTDGLTVDYTASGLGSAAPAEGKAMSAEFVRAASDFGFSMLTNVAGDGNVMISPVSLLYALGMTANGAAGETRTQMEKVLFGGIGVDEANGYFRGFADSLPNGKGGVRLTLADSIWLNQARGDFSVNAEFLAANAAYFDAGVFGVDFAQEDAAGQINRWTSEKTDGMIPKLLDDLSADALMVLVNTVLFDGKWKETYRDSDVLKREFTSLDGTKTKREMLSSEEDRYFRLGEGIGFIRPYAEKYSFVGILPDEGKDVFDYAASITGEAFLSAVTKPQYGDVQVLLPSFTFEWGASVNDALISLGMEDAFDGHAADFSGMGECGENIYIGEVIQKTKIELTREGTKAAAATAVVVETLAMLDPREPVRIYLDRPFVFAIVDNETGLPVFCGIVSELK